MNLSIKLDNLPMNEPLNLFCFYDGEKMTCSLNDKPFYDFEIEDLSK